MSALPRFRTQGSRHSDECGPRSRGRPELLRRRLNCLVVPNRSRAARPAGKPNQMYFSGSRYHQGGMDVYSSQYILTRMAVPIHIHSDGEVERSTVAAVLLFPRRGLVQFAACGSFLGRPTTATGELRLRVRVLEGFDTRCPTEAR
jgi:hypothetical protein